MQDSWPWWLLLLLAVAIYVLGLDGQYVPTNGDELVYTHIARLTAASGHWLPLVSDLDHMRNTKPPLLFWQAMVAGGWGENWSLAALRAPSVIYTLLIAAAVACSVRLITRRWDTACLAACLYLAFFCTFRFGRTYLTSAPETFWLNIPMFVLLWWWLKAGAARTVNVGPGWLAHFAFGLALGLGLAYKSFALIAPAAATLWCAQLALAGPRNWRTALHISLKVGFSASIALAIFGLWFVLDPDPGAVWQEFVLGENAGKMSNSAGYWQTALFGGGFSIWAQALGYVQNAGLLAFVVLGAMGLGVQQVWRSWRSKEHSYSRPPHLLFLLIWLGVWLLVFTLPSQRSARYLIPAMPALAILLALYWPRIARGWFIPSLLLCGMLIGGLGRIAWAEYALDIGSLGNLVITELALVIGLGLVIWGLLRPESTRDCTLAATLLVFAVFGLTTAPLNGASGQYEARSMATVQHQRIAVPSSFNGQFERFEFLLPGKRFVPYDGDGRSSFNAADNAQELQRLLATHDAVVWLQTRTETTQPLCLPHCKVLGQRWEVKGRHQSGEITLANLWYPQQWLFRREWLLASPGTSG
jgi:4-amino-4-deoxy-L-arabinose transferase-like glycosyltransferase